MKKVRITRKAIAEASRRADYLQNGVWFLVTMKSPRLLAAEAELAQARTNLEAMRLQYAAQKGGIR